MNQLKLFQNGRETGQAAKRCIDFIYTDALSNACCLAVRSGLLYGLNSSEHPCNAASSEPDHYHRVSFLDNDYLNYDHKKHLDAARYWRPKYATVRDVMTPEQCRAAGIEYYSLAQILDWAYELSEYAENVIVIPKHDCLDEIDPRFVFGYSVPTSHGGTPLPIEMFDGRPVHLLGGSWKRQLAYLDVIPNSVVSIDNNHLSRVAKHGGVIYPDGSRRELHQIGLGGVSNTAYVAVAISIGHIKAKLDTL